MDGYVCLVQMPLRLLLPFLEGSVRLAVEQARNAAVVRSLRRSENLQIREDLVKSKQRYAVSGTAAAAAHAAVFTYLDHHTLVHVTCGTKRVSKWACRARHTAATPVL